MDCRGDIGGELRGVGPCIVDLNGIAVMLYFCCRYADTVLRYVIWCLVILILEHLEALSVHWLIKGFSKSVRHELWKSRFT